MLEQKASLRQESRMSPQREASALGAWRRTLAGIPTLLGRLAYLAALRDPNTDKYIHMGLAQRIGDDDSSDIIARTHLESFEEWLCLGLERQKEELDEYLTALDGDRREILHNWLKLAPYKSWVPPESRATERDLFNADLGIVLEVLRVAYGVAPRDPES